MKFSPLDSEHRALGARLTPFGGWDMPLQYESGTIAEHLACRSGAVVFDVSHLGTVRVDGPDALTRLQAAFTNDLTKIAPGRAQYTHLLDPDDASVVDDIILWWVDEQSFDVMPNASNTDRVIASIGGVDTTERRAVLAIQGPESRAKLRTFFPEAAAVGRFQVARCTWNDADCTVAGTGYTGEVGVEIALPAEIAPRFWQALLENGVVPAGLGARDTLRLEAGLPLHGHELGPGVTPLQANLEWVVSWTKGDFIGRDALRAEKERGPSRILRGISTEGRRPPRADCVIRRADPGDDSALGIVTSGNFSPVLEHGIALAFVSPDVEIGQTVVIDVRGSELAGRVVATPFVSKK